MSIFYGNANILNTSSKEHTVPFALCFHTNETIDSIMQNKVTHIFSLNENNNDGFVEFFYRKYHLHSMQFYTPPPQYLRQLLKGNIEIYLTCMT